MDSIIEFIHDHAYHNSIKGLTAAKGRQDFYEKYGYTIRPNKIYGAGMTLFWSEA